MKDTKIVEIKKMWHQEKGRKMPIMFLSCGCGYVHTGNQEVGDLVWCTKCADARHAAVKVS
jgi:hypothetical protein